MQTDSSITHAAACGSLISYQNYETNVDQKVSIFLPNCSLMFNKKRGNSSELSFLYLYVMEDIFREKEGTKAEACQGHFVRSRNR